MSQRRLELHSILCGLLECPDRGDECRAYFQPPKSLVMKYPCFRYSRDKIDADKADNRNYLLHDRYQLVLMYKDPDSDLPHKVMEALPMCSHVNYYTADNLHHDIYNLYY